MSGFRLPAVASNLILLQGSSNSRKIKQNKSLSLLPRVLGSGLFFFMIAFFPLLAFAADVTLAWDPNSEADLEGYGVYFKKDAAGPPYDLFGNVTIQELDNPDNPTFTLTGLQKGSRYYFTVTAYDTAGNESAYAAPVCAEIGEQVVPCANADVGGGAGSSSGATGGGGSSGGGSGGGAGCFIATSHKSFHPHATIAALFVLGAVFFMGRRMFSRKKVFNK
jgi:hypothetical protein